MIRSMTGFGRSETTGPNWSAVWEIKSVNSRFLDLKWRLPLFLRCKEPAWEKVIRKHAARGRVDVTLNIQMWGDAVQTPTLNTEIAAAMYHQLSDFSDEIRCEFVPDPNRLLNISSLWQDTQKEPDSEMISGIEEGLVAALESWNKARAQEGESMKEDLLERVATLSEKRDILFEAAPKVIEQRAADLKDRIRTNLENIGVEYNEDRMLQEVAMLSDKLDVSEEMTRLATHLDRIAKTLNKGGEAGKRLDFLLQETFREINTCGNKIQNADASGVVVDFKAELEKCREQVQNIE